jgi:hypothetical protein
MAKMWREFPTLGKLPAKHAAALSRKALQLRRFQNWHARCNASGNPPNRGNDHP